MTEEQVTKSIINHLQRGNWNILSYDFPQSGTGKVLHSNVNSKKSIIPDIICIKDNICLLFENKNKYVSSDFIKLNDIVSSGEYTNSLVNFLKSDKYSIKTAIGFPNPKTINENMKNTFKLVNKVFLVETNGIVLELN